MKLSTLYEKLTVEQRKELAIKAGTSTSYLYQMAKQWNGKAPSLQKMRALCNADRRLKMQHLVEEFSN